jgi:hypothetical protein
LINNFLKLNDTLEKQHESIVNEIEKINEIKIGFKYQVERSLGNYKDSKMLVKSLEEFRQYYANYIQ